MNGKHQNIGGKTKKPHNYKHFFEMMYLHQHIKIIILIVGEMILEMEITIDDNGADLTAFRFDIAFDNDLITWVEDDGIEDNDETSVNFLSQGNSRVVKGSHISGWTEGDESSNADYSFEVVHFSNVGYTDSIQSSGNEQSATSSDYDWLRITMVSHGHDDNADGTPDKIFGNGDGNEVQVLKLQFRINDVVDNYEPHSFRIPTLYSGGSGYYTYVSDDYLLPYKVYIDGNWEQTQQTMVVQEEILLYTRNLLMLKVSQDILERRPIQIMTE